MRRLLFASGWVLLPACMLACGDGASSDPGLDALLRVQDAQFVPDALPRAGDGPEVRSVRVSHNTLRIGTQRERLSGTLALEANAVVIGREDDAGYWILTAGLPGVDEPELPTFSAVLGLSRATPLQPFALLLSAVDREGRLGPRERLELVATDVAVDGELVISLQWDNGADLDLHVLGPDGVEVWAHNINSFTPPPPGKPPAAPNAWQDGGMLDFDSNAQCVNDGRSEENVSWARSPPHGAFRVRIATASLCGQSAAHWSVEVALHGERITSARGISVAADTREQPGAGAGVQALEFTVP